MSGCPAWTWDRSITSLPTQVAAVMLWTPTLGPSLFHKQAIICHFFSVLGLRKSFFFYYSLGRKNSMEMPKPKLWASNNKTSISGQQSPAKATQQGGKCAGKPSGTAAPWRASRCPGAAHAAGVANRSQPSHPISGPVHHTRVQLNTGFHSS